MQKTISVNPFRCRMWALHDRFEDHVTEESCRTEIESFERHGQLVPALGRTLRGDPDYEVELIYGARRLFVARYLNKSLLVELREMSDREAVVAMDIENRQRADISPYERGVSYARWMSSGHFCSQDDIARALGVSSSRVSRLLKLSRLPSVIVNAFTSPLDIRETWGLDLLAALEDPDRRHHTLQKARAIVEMAPRPPPQEVYRALLTAAAQGRKPKVRARDEVIKDPTGIPLFRISERTNSVALLLPVEKLSAQTMDKIRDAVSDILQHSDTSIIDSSVSPRVGTVLIKHTDPNGSRVRKHSKNFPVGATLVR